MATFHGYEIKESAKKDGPTVWWDGTHIRSTSERVLRDLKRTIIPHGTSKEKTTLEFKDGEEFLEQLPQVFKTGYSWLVEVEVDEKGKKIK